MISFGKGRRSDVAGLERTILSFNLMGLGTAGHTIMPSPPWFCDRWWVKIGGLIPVMPVRISQIMAHGVSPANSHSNRGIVAPGDAEET